ncbi:transposase domain-containing protein [Acinetobacter terrestris]|uniref:transposase domain-containing protein n=1 Tax=Acinetobacter terrestris TaxID=2529843 RepID=UPI003D9C87FE
MWEPIRIGTLNSALIHSAELNGMDFYTSLSDLLKRFPAQKISRIEELLPHNWKPT